MPPRPYTHLVPLGDVESLQLLQDSLSTLEHLSLTMPDVPEVLSALSALHFPALKSLRLDSWKPGVATRFLAAHASQLTVLSCQSKLAARNISGMHFPRLQTLVLPCMPDNFVISAPALTHAEVEGTRQGHLYP